MNGNIAEQIKARREAIGLSQVKMAPAADVSHGTIRNAEAGKPLEAGTLRKIERALGWREGTTDALLSAKCMKILWDAFFRLSEQDEDAAGAFRKLTHVMQIRLSQHSVIPDIVEGFEVFVLRHLSQVEADAVWEEVSRAAGGGLARYGGGQVDATARSETVRGRASVPAPSVAVSGVSSVVGTAHATLPGLRAHAVGQAGEREEALPVTASKTATVGQAVDDSGHDHVLVVQVRVPRTDFPELDRGDIILISRAVEQAGTTMAKAIARAKRKARGSSSATGESQQG